MHPHYEKLLSIQARYTRLFLSTFLKTQDSSYYNAALSTVNYCNRFLLKENGLYCSAQDADLIQGEHGGTYFDLSNEERLALGIPAIDTNTFSDTNADFARSLLQLFLLSGDSSHLVKSQQIQQEISARSVNGLITHGQRLETISSLKDQLSYIRLLIDYLKFNPNAELQGELKSLIDTVIERFLDDDGSVLSYIGSNGIKATALSLENIHFARYLNWFASFTKEARYKNIAQQVYDQLTSDKNTGNYYAEPELVLLNEELNSAVFTYVGVSDSGYNELSNIALLLAPFYSLHANYSRTNLPEDKLYLGEYQSNKVLFVCNDTFCSFPIESLEDINRFVER